MLINTFKSGRGTWKLNTYLLKDENYIKLVNDCILEEKQKYAVPLYDFENFHMISDEQIHLTIDYELFLELILLCIHGETIRYASHKKIQTAEIKKKLISEINALEQENLSENINILDKKNWSWKTSGEKLLGVIRFVHVYNG